MIDRLRRLWRKRPYLLIAFLVALIFFVVFSLRAFHDARQWKDRPKGFEELQGWMTPRLLGHAYDIPPDILLPALGLDPDERRVTLRSLTEAYGMTLDDVQDRIDDLIRDMEDAGEFLDD